ncbi:MarR family transcriptional regulator [Niallia circulans]|nr:MarR family transcriptional regulator [Niallia circulans]
MDKVSMLNSNWTDIYYYLRYEYEEKITHQSIRILQVIEKETEVGIKKVAECIQISHNTASEHVKRLIEKKYIYKTRSLADERKVVLKLTHLGEDILRKHTSLDEDKLTDIFNRLTEEETEIILTGFKLLKQKASECNVNSH